MNLFHILQNAQVHHRLKDIEIPENRTVDGINDVQALPGKIRTTAQPIL
jgi:hypothetical protein